MERSEPASLNSTDEPGRISTGVAGLDDVLNGGLIPNRIYLVEGVPGAGKTTLGLHFLLDGIRRGESGLYITLSETAVELAAVARSHHWSLEGLSIHELVSEDGLAADAGQSVLHPSEVELGETVDEVRRKVLDLNPRRIVFDSLSELRLLAQDALKYRRQVLALKQFFSTRGCTVWLLDDKTSQLGDLQLHSITHGVIELDQRVQEYGAEQRRLRVVKMRGIKFVGGHHDFRLDTGGITVYPRLVAASHRREFNNTAQSTGVKELDALLGGGLIPGTSTLLVGPSGVGKTTTSVRCALTALQRGEAVKYLLFDETLRTLMSRSRQLDMALDGYIDNGQLSLQQIDPAEMSPGQFATVVREAVEQDGASMVVLDSLNAYMQAMPGHRYLLLQMHELLSYLNQQGVTTLLVLGQHGLIGNVASEVDLSYLSDALLLFRFFESAGEVLSALSVLKSRTSEHERTIREFRVDSGGLRVGPPLKDFEGVLTGLPSYRGAQPLLGERTGD
ncbi:ATPase domain-containing protein [Paraburkholderia phymatum]|uniref:non-specific serine/threonine protein kinase n=1 Tax=Paraburkholderia phymatum (strain DSM 17167 / CIP 108236 / LMG 21445 / STM815) TaxID=391038 RepID=B2JVR0_PARP8|nr:ATPase domain-containing protein [Paraburkholderia phymatum]ACC75037.1 Non-specific serine/threonine protein kinase [Paraburkholderia phymatum STM815]